jgi:hypothetical protein
MYVTLRYDFPISDFDVIKAGTKLEIIEDWNQFTGFIAVKYRQGSLYLNNLYFECIPAMCEVG